jgi:RHH-type proline utilization regulon transcriptional repressor/proline dehydrogenase/delta 1-pyrroline-5-carboxylate dehydrogenase
VRAYAAASPLQAPSSLPGPVGEHNVYTRHGRGRIALLARSETALLLQLGAVFATGNRALIESGNPAAAGLGSLPAALASSIDRADSWTTAGEIAGVLVAGPADELVRANREAAERDGPIVPVQGGSGGATPDGVAYDLGLLVSEFVTSTNTAAAGGNASLMSL